MKLLSACALALALSGCLSTTYAAASWKKPDDCIPPWVIAGDITLGVVGTYGGILYEKPAVAAAGGVMLGLSTLLYFAQMGECGGL
jgi:hypothetical protein